MVCTLRRVSAVSLAEIAASPDAAIDLMNGGQVDSDYPIEVVQERGCLGLLLRFTPITVTQVARRPESDHLPPPPRDSNQMGTEVWDVLHFLLTETAMEGVPPASFLVVGGTTLETEDDETDLRLFTPDEVGEIDARMVAP
ncbi:MAG: YfbM family protein [Gemmatimonadota bacterium]|nr:YfbM family protein [Gemmatimonadota bacterium]